MKQFRAVLLSVLFILSAAALPTFAQQGGVTAKCISGGTIRNGIEITLGQLSPNVTYVVTALGLDGFDPTIALAQGTAYECSTDAPEAAGIGVDLPAGGAVEADATSAQLQFSGSEQQTLIVGTTETSGGQFVVVIEGLNVSAEDGVGDPITVRATTGLLGSPVDLTTYMIRVDGGLDSLINAVDDAGQQIYDEGGAPVYCDDGGDAAICWGTASSLATAALTLSDGSIVSANNTDSMLSLPVSGLQPDENVNFLMTSYGQATAGNYVAVFHAGLGSGEEQIVKQPLPTATSVGEQPTKAPAATATSAAPPPTPVVVAGPVGVDIECPDGTSFNNGVQIALFLLRPGFTFTVTAIGVDDFDPVIALLDDTEAVLECNNNSSEAQRYTANLPTTGDVAASSRSAQLAFQQEDRGNLRTMHIVVGGFQNMSGEFILTIDGLGVGNDGKFGDLSGLDITQGMINSGVPLTVYMIAPNKALDTQINRMLIPDNSEDELIFMSDSASGREVNCDNAGTDSCYGESSSLVGASVTRTLNRTADGGRSDSMLTFPADGSAAYYLFGLVSAGRRSRGEYIIIYHIGISDQPGGSSF